MSQSNNPRPPKSHGSPKIAHKPPRPKRRELEGSNSVILAPPPRPLPPPPIDGQGTRPKKPPSRGGAPIRSGSQMGRPSPPSRGSSSPKQRPTPPAYSPKSKSNNRRPSPPNYQKKSTKQPPTPPSRGAPSPKQPPTPPPKVSPIQEQEVKEISEKKIIKKESLGNRNSFSIFNKSIPLDTTMTWDVHCIHILGIIDKQIQGGLHVCRRMASYLNKFGDLHLDYANKGFNINRTESSKISQLEQEDNFSGFLNAAIMLQTVMGAYIVRQKSFGEQLKEQIWTPLQDFCTTKEKERRQLFENHRIVTVQTQGMLHGMIAQRKTCLKIWETLLDLDNEMKQKPGNENIKSKFEKQKEKARSNFSRFYKDKALAKQSQEKYINDHLPSTLKKYQDIEMQRLSIMKDMLKKFSSLHSDLIKPSDIAKDFLTKVESQKAEVALQDVTVQWLTAYGLPPLFISPDSHLPSPAEAFDSSNWRKYIPGTKIEKDGEDGETDEEPSEDEDEQKKGVSSITNFVRGKVSKQKKRYRKDGFDLDLTYITKQLIAMGLPSEGVSSTYRNKLSDVRNFLDKNHSNKYKVYNLCTEHDYDVAKFHGRVAQYRFDDHCPCPVRMLIPFCEDVHDWVSKSDSHLAAIHCKAGKGRTGLMISCYLTYSRPEMSADDALLYYAKARTKNSKGVTIPSQMRYVRYCQTICEQMKMPAEQRSLPQSNQLQLMSVTIHGIPLKLLQDSAYNTIYFSIYTQERDQEGRMKKIYCSKEKCQLLVDPGRDFLRFVNSSAEGITSLDNDVCLKFYGGNGVKFAKLFHFWFNTRFIQTPVPNAINKNNSDFILHLTKQEIDKACKDKKNEQFRSDLQITCRFRSAMLEALKLLTKNEL